MRLLIDGDICIYSAGFAANKSDFITNVEYIDNLIFGIVDRFNPDEYTVFISGPANFRERVATLQPYKGNRDRSKRPKYYNELKEYLINFHPCEETYGIEADDAMGLAQGDDSIICTIDKDLRQIPGTYFNFRTHELSNISVEAGIKRFFIQMLTGDDSDNIPGIRNPAKAHHKVPPNYTEGTVEELFEGLSIKKMCREVQKQFKSHYGKDWPKAFDEIATLLWIQRKDQISYKDCNLFKVKLV